LLVSSTLVELFKISNVSAIVDFGSQLVEAAANTFVVCNIKTVKTVNVHCFRKYLDISLSVFRTLLRCSLKLSTIS